MIFIQIPMYVFISDQKLSFIAGLDFEKLSIAESNVSWFIIIRYFVLLHGKTMFYLN